MERRYRLQWVWVGFQWCELGVSWKLGVVRGSKAGWGWVQGGNVVYIGVAEG